MKFYRILFFLLILPHSGSMLGESNIIPQQLDIQKIQQNLVPLKTITLEYAVSESFDSGKTWSEDKRFLAKLNREKGYASLEEKRQLHPRYVYFGVQTSEKVEKPITVTIKQALKDGILTSIGITKYEKENNTASEEGMATIEKEIQDGRPLLDDTVLDCIFSYNSHNPRRPLFHDGKIIYRYPVFSYVKFNGKQALQLSATRGADRADTKYAFIFDIKTGLILEKTIGGWEKNGDKLLEKVIIRTIPSDYFFINGIPFPEKMTISFGDNQIMRISINKNKTKINEPLDDEAFNVSIPPGTVVNDEIKGIHYTVPMIGNFEAEEKIIKELDELFKKANK